MSSPTSPMVSNPTNKVGSTIVLKSLSILLGLFFIFIGAMKISPYLSKELHKDLRKEYVKYAKVFPLSSIFDFKIPSKWYRRIVGALEVVCGLAMALIPSHKIKNAANISLLLLMFLAVYSHYMVSDPFERSGPALVFTFMLGGRLVVWYQTEITQFYDLLVDEFFTSKREADLAEAAQIQANGGVKQD